MRPVFVGFLLVVDGFAVGALALSRPQGWWGPFTAFGVIFIGLVWFLGWSIRHRHDDD